MALPDPSLLVRALHLLAMAGIVGGALVLAAARGERADLAAAYERVFWPAAGVAVLTGLGNLGRLGEGAPGADSSWGALLRLKLLVLLALLLVSAWRAALVASAAATGVPRPRAVAGAAAATALLGVALAALGVTLAHA